MIHRKMGLCELEGDVDRASEKESRINCQTLMFGNAIRECKKGKEER